MLMASPGGAPLASVGVCGSCDSSCGGVADLCRSTGPSSKREGLGWTFQHVICTDSICLSAPEHCFSTHVWNTWYSRQCCPHAHNDQLPRNQSSAGSRQSCGSQTRISQSRAGEFPCPFPSSTDTLSPLLLQIWPPHGQSFIPSSMVSGSQS